MKTLLDQLRPALLDPQAESLAGQVQWWNLPGLGVDDPFPVAVLGQGFPLLLLHGFDSSFLEYRRLAPLLDKRFQLFIPDLFGFGFSPRPLGLNYGPEPVLRHLDALLKRLPTEAPVGLIGASMGGSVAVELAQRHSERVTSLLLLAPAGLTGRPMPVPPCWIVLGPGSWVVPACGGGFVARLSLIPMRMWVLRKSKSPRCTCNAPAGRRP